MLKFLIHAKGRARVNLVQLHAHVATPPLAVPSARGVALVLNLFVVVPIGRIEAPADPAEMIHQITDTVQDV